MPSAAPPAIRTPSRSGFTLIELSIVLVIIGLIVGGILLGAELIEAGRKRSIINAHSDFVVRWNTFKMKYGCLPGDCPFATRYFGTAPSCQNATNTATCNGDGDGWVLWDITVSGIRECVLVWNHLFLAGLSTYQPHDAVSLSTLYDYPYTVAPNESVTTFWIIGNSTAGSGWAQMYASATDDNVGSNLRGIGLQTARRNSVGGQPRVGVETPQTAYDLDKKIDDGIPAAGKFRASGGYEYGTSNLMTCITGSGVNSAYDLTQTDPTCRYLYSVQQ